ncbi:MAG: hypothetical protein A4S09_00325 [Proteobacteria bacterium SG_bin7]|nr:MAG: hypothetical protein A4S09_00325 [Proteobacteria bacterium SG_bin7]
MKKIVCLFPHCDDEYFVIDHLLKWKSDGHSVKACFLTHHQALGEKRRTESTYFLNRHRINDILFIDNPKCLDGKLPAHIKEILDCVSGFGKFDIILTPAWEGGHQDHDAAFVVGKILSQRYGSKHLQFSTYNGAVTNKIFYKVSFPIQSLIRNEIEIPLTILSAFKKCLGVFFIYPSQWKTWVGLAPFMLYSLIKSRAIKVFESKAVDLLVPPHTGKLLYERFERMTWTEFKGHCERALQTTGTARKIS